MKAVFMTIFALFNLIFMSACVIIPVPHTNYKEWGVTQEYKVADKYQGVYVFDKKLRDEIIQREKEREDYRKNRYNQMEEEKLKIVLTEFTEEERQEYKNLKDRIEKRKYVSDNEPILIKVNKINSNLWDKYPDLMEEKFPQTLSNGCKYFNESLIIEKNELELEPYLEKIKEFMGDENYEIIKPYIRITSYYQCGEKKVPLTLHIHSFSKAYLWLDFYTYAILVDDAPPRWHKNENIILGKSATRNEYFYYLIDGKFVKGEKIK